MRVKELSKTVPRFLMWKISWMLIFRNQDTSYRFGGKTEHLRHVNLRYLLVI